MRKSLEACFSSTTDCRIAQSRVLLVGAGGIGCEVLKTLVLMNFRDIHVVDLDTIDLSNLNRQFLFAKKDIGRSKAQVAAEAILRLCPSARVVSHTANISSPEFGIDFFRQFALVITALDNLDARRHVNRLCLAAEIPLVESATEGYLGQTCVIAKALTECFECQPRPAPKTYAVCTIRSNPSAPIHCITWAKLLFEHLFGKQDDVMSVTNLKNDEDCFEAEQQLKRSYAHWVFFKVFCKDICDLSAMEDLWKGRIAPAPLKFDRILEEVEYRPGTDDQFFLADQRIWSLRECAVKFVESSTLLCERLQSSKGLVLKWDKDDAVSLDFVTSATNLRCHIFGIKRVSRFDVKAKAGNIVPAVATTNAIIAGAVVLQALHYLDGGISDCRTVYLRKPPCRKRLLQPIGLEEPNKKCFVCSSGFRVVYVNTKCTLFSRFVHEILFKGLGFVQPAVSVGSSIVYECGPGIDEPEKEIYENNLQQPIGALVSSNVVVEDDCQNLRVNLSVMHREDFEDGKFYYLDTDLAV